MTIHLISYNHSGLSLLNEITPCFSPLKIYVPWGGTVPEYVDNREIIASYPPEDYKPEADFDRLLDECFNWAYEQGEKSRKEIIKTGHTSPTSNESLRHIKTILTSSISDSSERDMILRWHMLLHLANRLEENRSDANRMLENLKKYPSPLLDNADLTENTRYPLENLREMTPEAFINDANIKQLLKAWHGLFNSLTDKGDILLTIDRPVFDCLSEECNIYNNDLSAPEIVSFKSPLFKRSDINSAEITLGNDVHNIVSSNMEQADKIAALKKLTTEFETMYQASPMEKHINFSIFFFRSPEKPEEKESFIRFLSGRAIIFAQINA